MSGAKLDGATLTGADFRGADFEDKGPVARGIQGGNAYKVNCRDLVKGGAIIDDATKCVK